MYKGLKNFVINLTSEMSDRIMKIEIAKYNFIVYLMIFKSLDNYFSPFFLRFKFKINFWSGNLPQTG